MGVNLEDGSCITLAATQCGGINCFTNTDCYQRGGMMWMPKTVYGYQLTTVYLSTMLQPNCNPWMSLQRNTNYNYTGNISDYWWINYQYYYNRDYVSPTDLNYWA